MPHSKPTDRRYTVLVVLFVLAVIGLVVDLVDGYLPKILMSAGITVGLGAMILWRRSPSDLWRYIGMAGILLALGAMAYRLFTYFSA